MPITNDAVPRPGVLRRLVGEAATVSTLIGLTTIRRNFVSPISVFTHAMVQIKRNRDSSYDDASQ